MKLRNSGILYFNYSAATLVAFLFTSMYGCQLAEPANTPVAAVSKTVTVAPLPGKTKVAGAACCKVSFSRSKMLSAQNSESNISPSKK